MRPTPGGTLAITGRGSHESGMWNLFGMTTSRTSRQSSISTFLTGRHRTARHGISRALHTPASVRSPTPRIPTLNQHRRAQPPLARNLSGPAGDTRPLAKSAMHRSPVPAPPDDQIDLLMN